MLRLTWTDHEAGTNGQDKGAHLLDQPLIANLGRGVVRVSNGVGSHHDAVLTVAECIFNVVDGVLVAKDAIQLGSVELGARAGPVYWGRDLQDVAGKGVAEHLQLMSTAFGLAIAALETKHGLHEARHVVALALQRRDASRVGSVLTTEGLQLTDHIRRTLMTTIGMSQNENKFESDPTSQKSWPGQGRRGPGRCSP